MTSKKPYCHEPNPYRIRDDGAVEMELSCGKIALFDEADLPLVAPYRWFAHPRGYVLSHTSRIRGQRRELRMHRIILNPPDPLLVDHMNGDPLDNRRCNLRLATKRQNARNAVKPKGATSSRYKGVWWEERRRKWRAYIKLKHKVMYLGLYAQEADAAQAYNAAALKHFGEFARLNQL
ncbi:MAG TPA: HNH endonuclease [Anaerolineae bacterium]|nr:HNH endonuclease [Anaerolineae bacterium]